MILMRNEFTFVTSQQICKLFDKYKTPVDFIKCHLSPFNLNALFRETTEKLKRSHLSFVTTPVGGS